MKIFFTKSLLVNFILVHGQNVGNVIGGGSTRSATGVVPGTETPVFVNTLLNQLGAYSNDPEVYPNILGLLYSLSTGGIPVNGDDSTGGTDSYPTNLIEELSKSLPGLQDTQKINKALNDLSNVNGAGEVSGSLGALDNMGSQIGIGKLTELLRLINSPAGVPIDNAQGRNLQDASQGLFPTYSLLQTLQDYQNRYFASASDVSKALYGASGNPLLSPGALLNPTKSFDALTNGGTSQGPTPVGVIDAVATAQNQLNQAGDKASELLQPMAPPSSFSTFPPPKFINQDLVKNLVPVIDPTSLFPTVGDNLGQGLGYSLGSSLGNSLASQATMFSSFGKNFLGAAAPALSQVKSMFPNFGLIKPLGQQGIPAPSGMSVPFSQQGSAQQQGQAMSQLVRRLQDAGSNQNVDALQALMSAMSAAQSVANGVSSLVQTGNQIRQQYESQIETNNFSIPCTFPGKMWSNRMTVSLNNIDSVQNCQKQCQLNSNPLLFSSTDVNTTGPNCWGTIAPCMAITYSTTTGRCQMHLDLDYTEPTIEAPDMISSPVYCSNNDQFAQTVSQGTCLRNAGYSTIPGIKSILMVNDVEQIKSASEPAPSLDASVFVSVPSSGQGMWKHNPAIPDLLQNTVREVKWMRLPGIGYNGFDQNTFWGTSHGIDDWRECLILCNGLIECGSWVYRYDEDLYNTSKGACFLYTEKNITKYTAAIPFTATKLNQKSQFVVGPKVDPAMLSKDLFNIGDPSSMQMRRLDDYHFVDRYGYAIYIPIDVGNGPSISPMAASFKAPASNARDVSDCMDACDKTAQCIAYQFVSPTKYIYAQRMISNNTLCLLFSKFETDNNGQPKLYQSIPWMVTGIQTKISDELLTDNKTVCNGMSAFSTLDPAPLDAQLLTCNGGNALGDGISLQGSLISKKNTWLNVCNPLQCKDLCNTGISGCTAFTWTKAGVCYLFSNVTSYVREPKLNYVVSGFPNCPKVDWQNMLNVTEVKSSVADNSMAGQGLGSRSLSSCSQITDGTQITVQPNGPTYAMDMKTAQTCFDHCRSVFGCTFMTFNSSNTLCSLYTKAQVRVNPFATATGYFVAAAANECDYTNLPDMVSLYNAFESDDSSSTSSGWSTSKTVAVAVGSLGGAVVIGGMMGTFAWRRGTKSKESSCAGTPVSVMQRGLMSGMSSEQSAWSFIKTPGHLEKGDTGFSPVSGRTEGMPTNPATPDLKKRKVLE